MLWRREKVGRHVLSCLSVLLSTTVLDDSYVVPCHACTGAIMYNHMCLRCIVIAIYIINMVSLAL